MLHGFIAAPDNCAGSCLLGIYPGITTVDEALDRLRTQAWVKTVELQAPGGGYGQIRWSWSDQLPDVIDDSYPGRATFYWDAEDDHGPTLDNSLIETISIYTEIRMFSLQDWYGVPETGTANVRPDGDVGYSAAYRRQGGTISLSTVMPCPVNWMSYWNARTKLTISIGRGSSDYVPSFEMVKIC
jgi:hypothetical protein